MLFVQNIVTSDPFLNPTVTSCIVESNIIVKGILEMCQPLWLQLSAQAPVAELCQETWTDVAKSIAPFCITFDFLPSFYSFPHVGQSSILIIYLNSFSADLTSQLNLSSYCELYPTHL